MDIQPIADALYAHAWLLAGALFVLLVVAAAKQGWLSNWIMDHLPPAARPWVAVVLGVLSLMATDIAVAHKTWQQALFDGLGAAMLAVFGHQVVVEGARKGKEIVPPAPWSLPPPPPPAKPMDPVNAAAASSADTTGPHSFRGHGPAFNLWRRGLVFAFAAMLAACAGLPAVISYTGQDVACVITAVNAGASVPEAIAGQCKGLTLETIGSIIADFFMGMQKKPDGSYLSPQDEQLAAKLRSITMKDGTLAIAHPSKKSGG